MYLFGYRLLNWAFHFRKKNVFETFNCISLCLIDLNVFFMFHCRLKWLMIWNELTWFQLVQFFAIFCFQIVYSFFITKGLSHSNSKNSYSLENIHWLCFQSINKATTKMTELIFFSSYFLFLLKNENDITEMVVRQKRFIKTLIHCNIFF